MGLPEVLVSGVLLVRVNLVPLPCNLLITITSPLPRPEALLQANGIRCPPNLEKAHQGHSETGHLRRTPNKPQRQRT